MSATISLGDRLATAIPEDEYCCKSAGVTSSIGPGETPSKDDRFSAK